MFYGIYEHISQDGDWEEEVNDDWENDQCHLPVVLIEQLHWQGSKVCQQEQAQVPFEAGWLFRKILCFDFSENAF